MVPRQKESLHSRLSTVSFGVWVLDSPICRLQKKGQCDLSEASQVEK